MPKLSNSRFFQASRFFGHPVISNYYQHRTVFLQPGKQLVQHGQLAAVENEMLARRVRRTRFRPVEQVRVVAVLPQLHEQVQQAHAVRLPGRVDDVDVLHQDLRVPFRVGENIR